MNRHILKDIIVIWKMTCLAVTDIPHAFSVDPDEVIPRQDPAVSSERSSGCDGSDDETVGSVVFDVDLILKLKFDFDIDICFLVKIHIVHE